MSPQQCVGDCKMNKDVDFLVDNLIKDMKTVPNKFKCNKYDLYDRGNSYRYNTVVDVGLSEPVGIIFNRYNRKRFTNAVIELVVAKSRP